MGKKKDLLGDFEFKKLNNLSNGLEIPISNPLKQSVSQAKTEEKVILQSQAIKQPDKPKKGRKAEVKLPEFDYRNKEVKAMVNVLPTAKAEKRVTSTKDLGFNKEEFGSLQSKEERVTYLAMRGWSLKVEKRRNAMFHYATKYINRKKQRIYLGPVASN